MKKKSTVFRYFTGTLQIPKRNEERSLLLRKKLEENEKRLKEKMRIYENMETLQILKTNKDPYLLLDHDSEEAKQEYQWFDAHFPFDWGRVQWENIPNSSSYECEDNIEAVHIIKEFCKDLPANDQITIFWFNCSLPVLIMDLEIALKYADSLIYEDWDMWFFNKAQKWCLEVYHEGEVSMGYSPIQN